MQGTESWSIDRKDTGYKNKQGIKKNKRTKDQSLFLMIAESKADSFAC